MAVIRDINKIHSPSIRGVIIRGRVKDSEIRETNIILRIIYKLGVPSLNFKGSCAKVYTNLYLFYEPHQ